MLPQIWAEEVLQASTERTEAHLGREQMLKETYYTVNDLRLFSSYSHTFVKGDDCIICLDGFKFPEPTVTVCPASMYSMKSALRSGLKNEQPVRFVGISTRFRHMRIELTGVR
jgi:hypothetical protein